MVHQAVDAFCKYRNIEIDQQTSLPTPQTQVGEQLGFMNRKNSLDGFNLDHNLTSHQDV